MIIRLPAMSSVLKIGLYTKTRNKVKLKSNYSPFFFSLSSPFFFFFPFLLFSFSSLFSFFSFSFTISFSLGLKASLRQPCVLFFFLRTLPLFFSYSVSNVKGWGKAQGILRRCRFEATGAVDGKWLGRSGLMLWFRAGGALVWRWCCWCVCEL